MHDREGTAVDEERASAESEQEGGDGERGHELAPAPEEDQAPPASGAIDASGAVQADGDLGEPGPGRELTDDEIEQSVAALVFASPDPLGERRLAELLDRPEIARVRAALDVLKARLEASGLPFELRCIAGGYRILTRPALGEVVARLAKSPKNERISAAALETLAVVAYRQPVTKAEIEAIRGVQVAPILRSLVDRGLIRVAGRSDVPGHPLQYGTTRAFLERFGLASLEELPRDGELAKD